MTDRQIIEALAEALEDEYKARAIYEKVIERFGPVHPFVNIVEAEGRHIAALLTQFSRLGATPPADTWPERVKVPDSVAQACVDAAQAEVENDAMYSRLLEQVTDAEVRAVMLRLQAASRTQHLPPFQRCSERGNGGHGRGHGAAAR